MNSRFQVAIVGGGPSGSALALLLAQENISVVILDKDFFPRVKPCGGALDGVFFQESPFEPKDIASVTEDATEHFLFTVGGRKELQDYRTQGMVLTQRKRLDTLLLQRASEAGARVLQGTRMTLALKSEKGWEIRTLKGQDYISSQVLVGADGAYSAVAKIAGLGPKNPTTFVAAEWDVETSPQPWRGKVIIDASVFPLGYWWIFPKEEHLNIGWGVPKKKSKGIHELVEKTARRWGIVTENHNRYAHHLSFSTGGKVVAGNCLLIGDAAGVADPATGGGVGWAVKSARVASQHILSYLRGDTKSLSEYQEWYDHALIPTHRAAEALRNTILLSMAIKGRGNSSSIEQMIRCIEAKETYVEWAQKNPSLYVFGRLLQKAVDRLTR